MVPSIDGSNLMNEWFQHRLSMSNGKSGRLVLKPWPPFHKFSWLHRRTTKHLDRGSPGPIRFEQATFRFRFRSDQAKPVRE
ncbi:MAG: hypothetical protein CMJ23_00015 [Phycisphaerae bacterium]|nr:hypothetical protein [Phycisphaerae bacterium]